jgi:hypothetical protein
MPETKKVILTNDLTDFFRQEVISARSDLNVSMSELTEYYLVNLLTDFARRDGIGTHLNNEPLAFMYKRANEAALAERVQLLKNLGDVALYVAGFFTEFVERSMVDVDYYISMGGNAYHNLSGIVSGQRHGDTMSELYGSMAVKFTELVDVLNQISSKSHEKSDKDADLLKLYDRWARTGSERARKVLMERGLLTGEKPPTDYDQ